MIMDETFPQAQDTFEVVILNPEHINFVFEGENLTYTDEEGVFHPRVTLRRCFPLSSKDTNVIVRTPDKEMERGIELGMIEDVSSLSETSNAAVLRELKLHYVVPQILRIKQVREEFGFLYWSVETDRGPKDFILRDSIINSIRQVSKNRWLLIDINQTRYEVYDLSELDTQSQELLRRYLLL